MDTVTISVAAALIAVLVVRELMWRRAFVALRGGHATVQAIAESIYDGLAPALMPAAQENVRAHLEKLKQDGRASDQDGRWTL